MEGLIVIKVWCQAKYFASLRGADDTKIAHVAIAIEEQSIGKQDALPCFAEIVAKGGDVLHDDILIIANISKRVSEGIIWLEEFIRAEEILAANALPIGTDVLVLGSVPATSHQNLADFDFTSGSFGGL